MGTMKISTGPRYRRTGSPTAKRDREIHQLMQRIFAEAAKQPHTSHPRRAPSGNKRGGHAHSQS